MVEMAVVKPAVVKPSSVRVTARVDRSSKRQRTHLEMDLLGRTVHRHGREIELLPKEFQLLGPSEVSVARAHVHVSVAERRKRVAGRGR
jgi:hypothetical protein